MSVEQAGESVRGVTWLVSVAFSAVAGYLWAHRQRAAEVRALEQRLDAVKAAAAALLAERQRPPTAVDHLIARHNLTLAPQILLARQTARRIEAWRQEQREQGEAGR